MAAVAVPIRHRLAVCQHLFQSLQSPNYRTAYAGEEPKGGTMLEENIASFRGADVPQRTSQSRANAWLVFAVIFGLMLSDYMSRQVLNSVFPQLKSEWQLTDSQL